MSVTIKYKGNTIASANTDTTKTLQTSGKYCEADIVVENVQDGGITPSGSITLTEERSYDVTDKATAVVDFSSTRANLAEAVTAKGVDTLPTSSFDTIATNIGLISGGGGLDGVVQVTTTEDLTTAAQIHAFIVANHPAGWMWINTIPLTISDVTGHFMSAATFDNGSGVNNGNYIRRNLTGWSVAAFAHNSSAEFYLPAGTTLLMTNAQTI